ncbi:MAG: PEP-CTERM sorting domain-containing protein [Microcystaceae cyanobacterium]
MEKAQAVNLVTYSDRTTFINDLSALTTILTEDFNTITSDIIQPVSVGDLSFSAVGTSADENGIEAFDPGGIDLDTDGNSIPRDIDGTTHYHGDTVDTVVTVTVTPTIGFGWDFTSKGTGESWTILGQTVNYPSSNGFFGVINTDLETFTTITLEGDDQIWGADNVIYGGAVQSTPEPSSLVALLGLGGLGLLSCRKKQK